MHRQPVPNLGPSPPNLFSASASLTPIPQRNNLRCRSACSRCHAHKLKCPERGTDAESCARCVKAGEPCVFGLSVRGLPQSIVTETGLRTAKDMDMDVLSRKRTKRPRQEHAIAHAALEPRIDFPSLNEIDILSKPFEAGPDLEPQLDISQFLATADTAGESGLGSLNAEPAYAQQCSPLSRLDLTTPTFSDLAMDYFGPQGDGLELSLAHQSQDSLSSPFESVSSWENVPQPIPSDFSPKHPQGSVVWPPHKQLTKTTEDLTRLLLDLQQHAAVLARVITIYGSHPGQRPQEKAHQGNIGGGFAVDDTFQLTQTMIDIVEHLFKTEPEEDHRGPSSGPCISFAGVPLIGGGSTPSHHSGLVAVTGQEKEPPVRQLVGEPTFHLVISCWLRLGSIYHTIFGHINTCIETRAAPTTVDGQPVSVPTVRIGNFQMPFNITVTLQMFACLGMGSKLLNCMLGLVADIERSYRECSPRRLGKDGQPSQQPDVVEVICKDVKYRSNVLYQELNATRQLLIQSGIV